VNERIVPRIGLTHSVTVIRPEPFDIDERDGLPRKLTPLSIWVTEIHLFGLTFLETWPHWRARDHG
jgi:hypothetical protein